MGSTTMPYGRLAGLNKPVSRLILGFDNQRTSEHAQLMLDYFFPKGG